MSASRTSACKTSRSKHPRVREVSVVGVAAGRSHSLTITATGKAFGWGYGGDATLGLSLTLEQNQLVPLEYPHLRVL